jgi:hypothetical protein
MLHGICNQALFVFVTKYGVGLLIQNVVVVLCCCFIGVFRELFEKVVKTYAYVVVKIKKIIIIILYTYLPTCSLTISKKRRIVTFQQLQHVYFKKKKSREAKKAYFLFYLTNEGHLNVQIYIYI